MTHLELKAAMERAENSPAITSFCTRTLGDLPAMGKMLSEAMDVLAVSPPGFGKAAKERAKLLAEWRGEGK